jgi:predicted transcriptional regulator
MGEILTNTKEFEVENVIIVPMEDWNPSILSKKRKEILHVLKSKRVHSEMELANVLNRKRPNVLKDLKILEHYGLVRMVKNGNRVVPENVNSLIITY